MQFNDTPAMAAFRDEVRAFIDAEQPDYFRDGGEIEDPYFGEGSPPFREAFLEWRRRDPAVLGDAPAWACWSSSCSTRSSPGTACRASAPTRA